MKSIKQYNVIYDYKFTVKLFLLCWVTYFSTYLGRLNYSAAMAQMINDGFINKTQGGLIATFFFASYGVGQFISGFLGDKCSPFKMITIGIFFSSIANLVMGVSLDIYLMCFVWGINGLSQSMIWSPILRIFSQILPSDQRLKATLNINTTGAAGTLTVYLLSTLILNVSNWRSVFYVSSGILFLITLICITFFTINKSKFVLNHIEVKEVTNNPNESKVTLFRLLCISGVLIVLIPSAIHGMLKDGISSWFSVYLVEKHHIQPYISVLLTTIIPLVNLSGAYIAHFINMKICKDDMKTTAVMFLLSGLGIASWMLFGRFGIILSIISAAIATSAMFGANTMIISILPMYFGKIGMASTISGILNSATYLGGAISMLGVGSILDLFGWNVTFVVWLALAVLGALFSIIAAPKWVKYRIV